MIFEEKTIETERIYEGKILNLTKRQGNRGARNTPIER